MTSAGSGRRQRPHLALYLRMYTVRRERRSSRARCSSASIRLALEVVTLAETRSGKRTAHIRA